MNTILKSQYRWKDGHFQELEQNLDTVLSQSPKGTYIAVWNVLAQRWEFALSNGTYRNAERIWDINHLPPEFRAALLLVGVP